MTDYEPPIVSPDAVAERLDQIRGELQEVLALHGLFADEASPDARYYHYNLQNAALSIAVAVNRITSPTGSEPTVEPT